MFFLVFALTFDFQAGDIDDNDEANAGKRCSGREEVTTFASKVGGETEAQDKHSGDWFKSKSVCKAQSEICFSDADQHRRESSYCHRSQPLTHAQG